MNILSFQELPYLLLRMHLSKETLKNKISVEAF